MDGKGFMQGQALKVKVIVGRGRRNPQHVQDGNHEIVTVVECVSADGRILPPFIFSKALRT